MPAKFPVGPCFYHDIAVDIPIEFQKTVKIMYNLWMCKPIPPPVLTTKPRSLDAA